MSQFISAQKAAFNWNGLGTGISDTIPFQNKRGFFYSPRVMHLSNVPTMIPVVDQQLIPNLVRLTIDDELDIWVSNKSFYYPYTFAKLRVRWGGGGSQVFRFWPRQVGFDIYAGLANDPGPFKIPIRAFSQRSVEANNARTIVFFDGSHANGVGLPSGLLWNLRTQFLIPAFSPTKFPLPASVIVEAMQQGMVWGDQTVWQRDWPPIVSPVAPELITVDTCASGIYFTAMETKIVPPGVWTPVLVTVTGNLEE
jgi:hypothetical protein